MFLHLSLILLTGGMSAQVHDGIHTPEADTPRTRSDAPLGPGQTPPPGQTHTQVRHPPSQVSHPPRSDTLPGQTPLRSDNPSPLGQKPPRSPSHPEMATAADDRNSTCVDVEKISCCKKSYTQRHSTDL